MQVPLTSRPDQMSVVRSQNLQSYAGNPPQTRFTSEAYRASMMSMPAEALDAGGVRGSIMSMQSMGMRGSIAMLGMRKRGERLTFALVIFGVY